MYVFPYSYHDGAGRVRERGTRAAGHPKIGNAGCRKEKGHRFALNMYEMYMNLSPGGSFGHLEVRPEDWGGDSGGIPPYKWSKAEPEQNCA